MAIISKLSLVLNPVDFIQAFRVRFGVDRKLIILRHIKKSKPRSILEIGVFNGIFAARMLNTSSKLGSIPHYVGVDLFAQGQTTSNYINEISLWPKEKDEIQTKLQNEFPKCIVELIAGASRDILPKLVDYRFDLIFIDGGHSYETVKNDFENCLPLLNEGGTIFLDDYTNLIGQSKGNFGIRKLVDELDKNKYKIKIYLLRDYFLKNYGLLSLRVVKIQLR